MKGIILTNQFDDGLSQRHKVNRMVEEFSALGVTVDVVPNCGALVYLNENGNVVCNVNADFVLYFDKDKYAGQLMEMAGLRLFNKPLATAICDDKMQTHLALANSGIPMPATFAGALCYNPNGVVNKQYLAKVANQLGFPLVVKQCYGSFGEQVHLVDSMEQLTELVSQLKMTAYLFQQYVASSHGKDMRVIVIGGKVACGMMRSSDGDFRSNVERGGVATAVEVPQNVVEMCQKAAQIVGLDYCGIDVLVGDQPLLCEVNSNAMFAAMEQTTQTNVAKLYAQHIVDCVTNGK